MKRTRNQWLCEADFGLDTVECPEWAGSDGQSPTRTSVPAALPQVRFEPILLTLCFAVNVGFLGKVKEISAIYTNWTSHRLISQKASA